MVCENGSDMIWNPTSTLESTNDFIWGGKHVIYIMGNTQGISENSEGSPRYDSCQWIYNNLISYEENEEAIIHLKNVWTSAMWCAIPIQNPEFNFLDCDVKIILRVATPYHQEKGEFEINNPIDNNFPVFKFSTHGLKAETSN